MFGNYGVRRATQNKDGEPMPLEQSETNESPATPACRVAVVTKGHPFDAPAFFDVFDSNADIEWTHVEHPEAMDLVEPDRAAEFDVFVMYDMPGIDFTRADPPASFRTPPG